ncbi:MAG: SRPBCC family protein [Thermoanaerobaculia bacterium]
MTDILHRISADAPSDGILKAITTAEGFRKWWTDDCAAVPEVGSVNIFRFDGGAIEFHFRVDELTPNRVAWTCLAAPKVPEEWVGTRATFDLEPSKAGGTLVRFGHLGWRSTDGEFPACNTVWGDLMHRLKEYAEGRPRGPYFS